MPKGGSKKGERRGGRKKGTPNRVTTESRETFQAVYDGLVVELKRWIKETGDGFDIAVRLKDGSLVVDKKGKPVMVTVGKDPCKASELLLRMAEHFIPKLSRHEVVGDGGGAVVVRVDRDE